jgi:ABC-type phosphate transport system substrate-binding protein
MTRYTRQVLLLGTAAAAALLVAGARGAQAQTVVTGGGSSLAGPTYSAQFGDFTHSGVTYSYYQSGSGAAQSAFINNSSVTFGGSAPTGVTVDFAASDATLTTTQINTFQSTYGYPLIQLPTFATPITIPFNVPGKTTIGSEKFTNGQLCGIFSGTITDWHTIDTTIPAGTTIQVQYRSDGSGTSFLLTQHLAAVCNANNSNFTGTLAATTGFTNLFAGGSPPPNFHGNSGSGGVEAGVNNTSYSIGYLSPDYTQEAPVHRGNTAYPVVALVNGFEPSVANVKLAIGNAPVPTNPANQAQWVPAVPNPGSGYPIVGFTTFEVSSCYQDASTGAGVVAFLQQLYNASGSASSAVVSAEAQNGFATVSGASTNAAPTAGSLAAAIVSTFLTSTGSLAIDNSGCPATGGR